MQSVQSSLAPEYFQGGALETNPSEEDQVLQYTLHCGTICCGQRGVRAAAYTRRHFVDPQQALQKFQIMRVISQKSVLKRYFPLSCL